MKLELARAGNQGGVMITPEDLLSMAQNFVSDVPVTIGHESDDSMPAYGWVKSVSLSADGNVLTGDIELGSELAEAFAEGRYKNWSIGAARNDDDSLYLHHVAFLGAVPPMIKGLKVIEMGDRNSFITLTGTGCEFTFSDSELSEYSALKTARRQQKLKKLSDTIEGKLPFGKKDGLMKFADEMEKQHPELCFSDVMADVFSSVKQPVSARTQEAPAAAGIRKIFSKI